MHFLKISSPLRLPNLSVCIIFKIAMLDTFLMFQLISNIIISEEHLGFLSYKMYIASIVRILELR